MGRHSIPRPYETGVPAVVAPYGEETDRWVRGFCMLRCRREDVSVTHVGVVSGDGVHMPLFACSACLQEMRQMQMMWAYIRDGVYPETALVELNRTLLQNRFAA